MIVHTHVYMYVHVHVYMLYTWCPPPPPLFRLLMHTSILTKIQCSGNTNNPTMVPPPKLIFLPPCIVQSDDGDGKMHVLEAIQNLLQELIVVHVLSTIDHGINSQLPHQVQHTLAQYNTHNLTIGLSLLYMYNVHVSVLWKSLLHLQYVVTTC